jgi:hypothetical protein
MFVNERVVKQLTAVFLIIVQRYIRHVQDAAERRCQRRLLLNMKNIYSIFPIFQNSRQNTASTQTRVFRILAQAFMGPKRNMKRENLEEIGVQKHLFLNTAVSGLDEWLLLLLKILRDARGVHGKGAGRSFVEVAAKRGLAWLRIAGSTIARRGRPGTPLVSHECVCRSRSSIVACHTHKHRMCGVDAAVLRQPSGTLVNVQIGEHAEQQRDRRQARVVPEFCHKKFHKG